MSLTPGTGVPEMNQDSINRGLFFWMGTDPVVRLWVGNGDIRIAANDLDPSPEIYKGLGFVKSLPEIDRLINGEARRVTVAISGLDASVVSVIDDDMIGVEGVKARIGQMRYDRRWRPTGAIRWVWDGTVDECSLRIEQKEGGHECTFSISMASALVDRNRPALRFWTPKDQAAISPTDKGFNNVPSYNAGTTRLYPPR